MCVCVCVCECMGLCVRACVCMVVFVCCVCVSVCVSGRGLAFLTPWITVGRVVDNMFTAIMSQRK